MTDAYDNIDGHAEAAQKAIKAGEGVQALLHMEHIRGICSPMITIESVWELVKEAYEAGESPLSLSRRFCSYGVTTEGIKNRSYHHKWVSPRKLKKALVPPRSQKGNTFLLICKLCEKEFVATSGNASVCSQCVAMEMKKKAIKRSKA